MSRRLVTVALYEWCPYRNQCVALACCHVNSRKADHYCYDCDMPTEWKRKHGLRTYKRQLIERTDEYVPTGLTWIYSPRDAQGEKWMATNNDTGERVPAEQRDIKGDPNCDICKIPYMQMSGGCTQHRPAPASAESIPSASSTKYFGEVTEEDRERARARARGRRSDERYYRNSEASRNTPSNRKPPTKKKKKRKVAPSVASAVSKEARRLAKKEG